MERLTEDQRKQVTEWTKLLPIWKQHSNLLDEDAALEASMFGLMKACRGISSVISTDQVPTTFIKRCVYHECIRELSREAAYRKLLKTHYNQQSSRQVRSCSVHMHWRLSYRPFSAWDWAVANLAAKILSDKSLLPIELRVLELSFEHDYTIEEIAEELCLSHAKARQLLTGVLLYLKEKYSHARQQNR